MILIWKFGRWKASLEILGAPKYRTGHPYYILPYKFSPKNLLNYGNGICPAYKKGGPIIGGP